MSFRKLDELAQQALDLAREINRLLMVEDEESDDPTYEADSGMDKPTCRRQG